MAMMKRDWRDFKAIYGGSEGARSAFEHACRDLLQAMFPDQNVQPNRPNPGDGGIDIFVGKMGQEPIKVYQCKFHLEQIGPSQKAQIRESLAMVFSESDSRISTWTLCIPKDFDKKEHEWWAEWSSKASTRYGVTPTLWSGGQLITLMQQYKVYDRSFQIEESLKLDDIHRNVRLLRGIALSTKQSEQKHDSTGILEEPVDTLILHFFDHYILQLAGFQPNVATPPWVYDECALATKFALMAAQQVLVPAVSYYQSALCRSVLDQHKELIADAYSIEEFRENRLREYKPDSEEGVIYTNLDTRDCETPSLASSKNNTTVALHEGWKELLPKEDLGARFASKLSGRKLPKDFDKRLEKLPQNLELNAFILRNAYSLLFDEVHIDLANELLRLICELFFESFSDEFQAGFITDLVYLNQIRPPSSGPNVRYRALLRNLQLSNQEFLGLLQRSAGFELLLLAQNPIWRGSLIGTSEPSTRPRVTLDSH
jgi:hypothetical protein